MKIIYSIVLMLTLLSCNQKNYKYEIRGNVMTKNGHSPAVFYTDSISYDGDTLFYTNSDNTEVRIYPPYNLIQNY
jgi:hypothetical protein